MNDDSRIERLADHPTVQWMYALAAVAIGCLGDPLAGLAAGAGKETFGLAKMLVERRATRARPRMSAFAADVSRRVPALASITPTDEQLDLAQAVIEQLIADDDERKTPFYAAVMEWVLNESTSRSNILIVSDGIRRLTYPELYCFLMHLAGRGDLQKVCAGLGLNMHAYEERSLATGLRQRASVGYMGSPTDLGKLIADCVPLESLERPVHTQ